MTTKKAEYVVVQILNGVLSAELNGRITPLTRDDGGLLPAIVYTGSEPFRQRYIDGSFMDIASVEMAFEIWAKSYVEAKRIAGTAMAALNNFSGEIAGVSVLTIDCEASQEAGFWDGDELVVEFTANISAKGI